MSPLRPSRVEALEPRLLLSAQSFLSSVIDSAEQVDIGPVAQTSVQAQLLDPGQIDSYSFTAEANGWVVIDMDGEEPDVDSLLYVYDASGARLRRVGRNDNASRDTLDSQVRLRARAGHTYYVLASSRSQGGAYSLTINANAYDDYANSIEQAQALSLSSRGSLAIGGRINYADDVDVFALVATATGTMQVDLSARGRRNNLDCELFIYDADGTRIAHNDDNGFSLDSRARFDVVAGQTYYLKAASWNSASAGIYRLAVRTEPAPPPAPEPQPEPEPQPQPQPEPEPEPQPAPAPVIAPGNSITTQVINTAAGLQLLVLGTDAADVITVSQTVNGLTLTTGAGSASFAGAFTGLTIFSFGGDDMVRIVNNVTVSGVIYAGDGNDSLFEASIGSWQLNGGAGDDLLVAIGGGADVLAGDGGFDSFWSDTSDTISDASAAESAGKAVHRVAAFYQPYTTNASDSRYVSLEIAGQNFQDPAASYGYRSFAASPLFVDGPQYDDVRQGAVGDCYYLASLSSLADTDPNLIRQAITPLGDGTYAVRFYRNGQEVYLRIDADLPTTSSGSLVYARTSAAGEIWSPLMEKAYAYFRYGENSYASISAGWMSTVNRELTNMGSQTNWTGGNTSSFLSWAAGMLDSGHAVTLGSNSSISGPIVGGHAYVVKSVDTAAGTMTVYNPWGYDGATRTDSNYNDGLVTLSGAQVQQYFMGGVASLA